MEIHHTKHHATYITNLNAAEEQLQDAIGKSWYTLLNQFLKITKNASNPNKAS